MSGDRLPLSGKKLLVLDGSQKAVEIVDQGKRLGLHVAVTDYNDPAESPAKLAADEYFMVSAADVDAVVELIRHESIDGVVTGFSDRWLPTYAEICRKAGLHCYASVDQLRLFTDKRRYKQLMDDHGVPTVEGFTVQAARAGIIPKESFPLLVKPADGSGSRGISICHSEDELHKGIASALEYSWTDEVVIERFLPGEEATVYWVFQDGEYHVAVIANRHMRALPGGEGRLPVAYSMPSYLTPSYMRDIAPRVRSMLRAAGVKNGIMFMQGLVDEGVFRTYDIGFRITPTQEYKVLEALCDYNPLLMHINYAVTGSMGEPRLSDKANPMLAGYGFNVSTLMMPGQVHAFEGLDAVAALPGVLAVSTALTEGETLPDESLGQLRQIAVRTIGVSASREEMQRLMLQVGDTIVVRGQGSVPLTIDGVMHGVLEGKLL